MVYEPLHHKYRPQTFSDLVGQDAIAKTLINALISRRIAPAYLFTGPRGTGKTSSARILAKSLNCLASEVPTPTPCGQCEVCRAIAVGSALDIIEIDAASNTGVDNIREIIERSQFAPVQCRYKVYVIDECLTGDNLVLTSTGLLRIDDPDLQGKQVLSYNESSQKWEYKQVLRWIERGIKPTLLIKTKEREIRCTDNHLIRTEQGWSKAKNLKVGMKILSPVNADVERSLSSMVQIDKFVDSSEDINLKEIPTDKNHPRKINLLPLGLQNWDILLQQNLILEKIPKKPITTLQWESKPLENGSQTYDNIRSPQWITNLEQVESIEISEEEKVYDIEVADNHNFVANGLLVHNCHMLSTAAFNALLKTLEEPPDRVIFVLATTDPQRVLPTIISRCQRFDYRRIPLQDMVDHLSKIAHLEDIDIDPEAVTLVAQIANGGLRDAESLLDQLSLLSGTITPEKVWELVGAVPERDLLTLLQAIHSNEPETILDQCRHLLNRGREPLVVLQNLASFYLNLLIAKTAPHRPDLVAVTAPTWKDLCTEALQWDLNEILRGQQHLKDSESQLKNTTQPRLWLEVTLLGLLTVQSDTVSVSIVNQTRTPVNLPPQKTEITPSVQAVAKIKEIETKPEPVPTPVQRDEPATVPTSQEFNLEQIWQQVLEVVQPVATKSLLKGHVTILSFNGSVAEISIASEGLLKVARQKVANIEEAFARVSRQPVKVNIHLASSTPQTQIVETPQPISDNLPEPIPSVVPTPQPKIEKSSRIQPQVPPPVVSVSKATPEIIETLQTPVEETDNLEIRSVAENFAKIFDGEIVTLNPKVTEESENRSTETLKKSFVAGRPMLDDIAEDEDIPF